MVRRRRRCGRRGHVWPRNVANSARISWTREEVDDKLHKIMISIHRNCYETAEKYGTPGNLVNGANIAGSSRWPMPCWIQGLV